MESPRGSFDSRSPNSCFARSKFLRLNTSLYDIFDNCSFPSSTADGSCFRKAAVFPDFTNFLKPSSCSFTMGCSVSSFVGREFALNLFQNVRMLTTGPAWSSIFSSTDCILPVEDSALEFRLWFKWKESRHVTLRVSSVSGIYTVTKLRYCSIC